MIEKPKPDRLRFFFAWLLQIERWSLWERASPRNRHRDRWHGRRPCSRARPLPQGQRKVSRFGHPWNAGHVWGYQGSWSGSNTLAYMAPGTLVPTSPAH